MKTIWPLPKIQYTPLGEHREERAVALLTSRAAWDAVGPRLTLPIRWRAEVAEATEEHWKMLLDSFEGEVVYAVGGGLAFDAAKYIAAARGLPLVGVPTAISVDAFLTWASGIRHEGCVRYLVTRPPDRLIVDLETLATAPEAIRAAGICDVLSIATGLWDWHYAGQRGLNPPGAEYLPWAATVARGILEGALDCAESAGAGEPEGLRQLLDGLALEVQLCNQLGHSRPEEGSEHYFAYAVENTMGKGLPHGDLVGPGIVLMAEMQGQDPRPLRRALRACHVPLDNIPDEVIRATLRDLPDYCRRHNLMHGLAHDLEEA